MPVLCAIITLFIIIGIVGVVIVLREIPRATIEE